MTALMGYGVAFFLVCCDGLTKAWALHQLVPYQAVAVFPGLNWLLAFNSGSAFSFLAHSGAWHVWFFLIFSLLMSALIIIWMARLDTTHPTLERLAFSFILAGALGNCFDRIRFGYVIDFIDLYIGDYHWPVFNLADSAICIGVGLLVIEALSKQRLGISWRSGIKTKSRKFKRG